jgi:hypothetical protein
MEAAHDAYARIKADSPWRWVPVLSMLGIFGALLVDDAISQDGTSAPYWVAALGLSLLFFSWFKVGSGDAVGAAIRHAKATGGERVSSHPTLVLAMRVAGIALISTCITMRFVFRHEHAADRTDMERIVGSLGFYMIALFLTMFGWTRPWDLKVVQREAGQVPT